MALLVRLRTSSVFSVNKPRGDGCQDSTRRHCRKTQPEDALLPERSSGTKSMVIHISLWHCLSVCGQAVSFRSTSRAVMAAETQQESTAGRRN